MVKVTIENIIVYIINDILVIITNYISMLLPEIRVSFAFVIETASINHVASKSYKRYYKF